MRGTLARGEQDASPLVAASQYGVFSWDCWSALSSAFPTCTLGYRQDGKDLTECLFVYDVYRSTGPPADTYIRVSSMALPTSLMGFGLFRMVSKHIRLPFSPVENVLVQTVAGSMAIMPLGCGFVGVV